MSIKIKDIGTKYILDWNVDKSFLSLSTYSLSTWNQTTEEYDTTLDSIKKIGSPDYGNMFDFSSGSITSISIQGGWYLLNCTTTSLYTRGFTHSNGRLTKVGDAYGPIKMEGNIDVSGSNNDQIHVQFYKNGSGVPCSLGSIALNGSGKGNTIPFHCMADMLDGDYIEVYVSNDSGGRDITLLNLNVILTELV